MEDLADLVARRADVLAALSEPRTKPEVVAESGRARSTVDRAILELEEADLACREGSTYRRTRTGAMLLAEREDYRDRLDVYYEARPFVDGLEPDDPIDPALLRNADVDVGTETMPEKGVKRNIEIVKEATRVWGVVPRMYDIYTTLYTRRVLEEGMEVRAIYDPETFEVAAEEYDGDFADLTDTGNVEVFVSEGVPSYGISVTDTPDGRVVQGEVDPPDGPRVGLTNDSEAAVAWVEDLLTEIEADARRVQA